MMNSRQRDIATIVAFGVVVIVLLTLLSLAA